MGLISNLVKGIGKNKGEFKAKLKQAQEDLKIQNTLEERQMSSNERELLKHQKQIREDDIKKELDKIHKQQNSEMWKSKNLILGQKTTILKNDRPILMEKNIFLDNKTKTPLTKKELFFKW